MAEHIVNWSSGDLVSRTKQQNMADNSVNDIDDIHVQYIGPVLFDGTEYGISNADTNRKYRGMGDIAVAAGSLVKMVHLEVEAPGNGLGNVISFKVGSVVSIDVTFSYKTGAPAPGANSAQIRIYKYVPNGADTIAGSGISRSSVSATYAIAPSENFNMSVLSLSPTDFISVALELGAAENGIIFVKGLKVIRNMV